MYIYMYEYIHIYIIMYHNIYICIIIYIYICIIIYIYVSFIIYVYVYIYICISTQMIIIKNNNGGFSWIFLASTKPPGFLARASKNCEAQSKEGNKSCAQTSLTSSGIQRKPA